jgi:hypothetical protein
MGNSRHSASPRTNRLLSGFGTDYAPAGELTSRLRTLSTVSLFIERIVTSRARG